MAHYDLNDWANLALGDLPEALENEMNVHLSSGCARCRELAVAGRELTGMADTGGRGPVEFPEHVLWAARLIFGPAGRRRERLPMLPVELAFESITSPAGVRAGSDPDSWQGVYRTGGVSIDLRMELDPSCGRVALFGQVADADDPSTGMPHLVTCLRVQDDIVDRAMTNEAGEFGMEYDARVAPELRIGIPERGLFAVTLDHSFVDAMDQDWTINGRPSKGASP